MVCAIANGIKDIENRTKIISADLHIYNYLILYYKNAIGDCLVKRKGLPAYGELVLCTVQRITPYAAWCKLDEYDAEGMVHISEVAGKWIHDIREFVKPNKKYIAKVVKIDEQNNLLNLSLKRVSKIEEKRKMNDYRKEQRAQKILEQAAKEMGKNLEQAYDEVGFLLQENFGELYDAFEEISKSKNLLEELDISKDWAKALLNQIGRSFKEKEIVLKVDLELKSYAEDGVQRIKKMLASLDVNGVKVKYISAPRYRIEVKTKNPKIAEKNLKENIENMLKQAKAIEMEGSYRFVK